MGTRVLRAHESVGSLFPPQRSGGHTGFRAQESAGSLFPLSALVGTRFCQRIAMTQVVVTLFLVTRGHALCIV